MSFLTHHSRHSWPPFVHFNTPPAATQPLSKNRTIDEDPFSFFVSPDPSDEEDFADDWTAGISSSVTGSLPSALNCGAPPSRFCFHRSVHAPSSSVTEASKTPAAIFRRWTAYVEKHQPHLLFRHQNHSSSKSLSPASSPASSPRLDQALLRGRRTVELDARARGRRLSRSRSSRPHSWREPSVGLYTVPEEEKEGEGDDKRENGRIMSEKKEKTRMAKL